MRAVCSAAPLYDQIGSMFRQQKVIISFSTQYFSSTDSFGESTETNSRNAHNFSNSRICALSVTLLMEYRVIKDSVRILCYTNSTAAGNEPRKKGTSMSILVWREDQETFQTVS